MLAFTLALAGSAQAQVPTRQWLFDVRLDDQLVGEHRFELTGNAAEGTLRSEAAFTVRLLGIAVYRYRHSATEQWRQGCLQSLASTTDDNGEAERVQAEPVDGGGLRIARGDAERQAVAGCVMSFAYWNPAIRQQARLLNPQTGLLETVRFERAGSAEIPVRGKPVAANRWVLKTNRQTLELWEAADSGDWIGLDSTVSGRRQIRYRLR